MPLARFSQSRDVARQQVDFQIHRSADRYILKVCHLPGMRDHIDAEGRDIRRILDLVHRQRDTVDRDRPFRRNESAQGLWGGNGNTMRIAFRADCGDLTLPVDMARHDVTTQLVTQSQSRLKVDIGTFDPIGERGF